MVFAFYLAGGSDGLRLSFFMCSHMPALEALGEHSMAAQGKPLRKSVPVLLVLSTIVMLVLISASPAQSAAPVNVFSVDNYYKVTDAGSRAEFKWVLFNNVTSPYLIKASVAPSVSGDISEEFSSNFITLDPNQSTTITLVVNSQKSMATINVTFIITLQASKMNDPSQVTEVNETASLLIKSVVGQLAGQNKLFGIWDNRLPSPLDGNPGAFAVTLAGWIVIALAVAFVIDPLVHFATRKTETMLDDMLLEILRGPMFVFIIAYGVVNSVEIMTFDRDLVANIEYIYHVAVIMLIVWAAYKIYKNIVLYYAKEYASKTDTDIDDVLVPLLEKIGMIIIPLLGLVAVLNMMGYDITVLLAGVGFLGIVIGFAAQSTLSNFFAGMQLLATRPFKTGDLLQLDNGDICEVKHIGMRATELYNPDTNELVIIPNDDVANKKIINLMEPDVKLKLVIKIDVAYGSDVEKVMRTLKETGEAHPNVLKDPEHPVVVRFSDFGESALNFKVFIWIDDVANRYKVPSDYRQAIDRRFREEGIEIPFPQTVVHFKDETERKN